MHIGVTGTQIGMTAEQKNTFYEIIEWVVEVFGSITLHLGDCIGADEDAYFLATENLSSVRTVGHIPMAAGKRAYCTYDEERPPKEYLKRNHDIVDESKMLIATPEQDQEIIRSGTWATIRYAKKKGVPVALIYPDGRLAYFGR